MKIRRSENPEEIKRYEHIKPAPIWGALRCFAKYPGDELMRLMSCTLSKGHSGPHVSHGFFKNVLAVWDENQ